MQQDVLLDRRACAGMALVPAATNPPAGGTAAAPAVLRALGAALPPDSTVTVLCFTATNWQPQAM